MHNTPADLQYTPQHEWLRVDRDTAVVGITRFAADSLGDIVFVDLPDTGARFVVGEPCGELESTKSVNDIYAPASGEVVAVNRSVLSEPGLVNTDPFGAGWLFKLRTRDLPDLLDADGYAAYLDDQGT